MARAAALAAAGSGQAARAAPRRGRRVKASLARRAPAPTTICRRLANPPPGLRERRLPVRPAARASPHRAAALATTKMKRVAVQEARAALPRLLPNGCAALLPGARRFP